MTGKPAENRRRQKRYGVKDSAISFSKAGLMGMFSGKSEPLLVLDISEEGVYFMSPRELKLGEALSVEISAPRLESPIKAAMEVKWCRPSSQKNAWKIGLRFTKITESATQRLRHLLNNAVLDRIDVSTVFYFKESKKLQE